MRVLVVDDDFFILSGVRKMLERDHKVKTASDEESALMIAEDFRPHVAFVDLILGYDNGLDVIEKLRAMLPDTAIVLMSGHYAAEEEFEAIGADGFLAKDELALIGAFLSRIERAA